MGPYVPLALRTCTLSPFIHSFRALLVDLYRCCHRQNEITFSHKTTKTILEHEGNAPFIRRLCQVAREADPGLAFTSIQVG